MTKEPFGSIICGDKVINLREHQCQKLDISFSVKKNKILSFFRNLMGLPPKYTFKNESKMRDVEFPDKNPEHKISVWSQNQIAEITED
jgi:hypothetical protein